MKMKLWFFFSMPLFICNSGTGITACSTTAKPGLFLITGNYMVNDFKLWKESLIFKESQFIPVLLAQG